MSISAVEEALRHARKVLAEWDGVGRDNWESWLSLRSSSPLCLVHAYVYVATIVGHAECQVLGRLAMLSRRGCQGTELGIAYPCIAEAPASQRIDSIWLARLVHH